MTTPHVTYRELVDLAEKDTAPPDVERHLATCRTCRLLMDDIADLLETMSYARSLDTPPARLLAAASTSIRKELALRTGGPGAAETILRGWVAGVVGHVRSVTAQLIGDSFQAAAAVRAGSEISAAPRMLLYETDTYEITVSIAPSASPGAVDVSGQVTPRQGDLPAGGIVSVRADGSTATSELSTFGVFTLDALPSGELEIEVGLDDSVIRLVPVPRPAAD